MKVSILVFIAAVSVVTAPIVYLATHRPPNQCTVVKHSTNGKEIRWISVGKIHPFGEGFKFHDKYTDSDVIISGDIEFVKFP